ncbi:hypothetical protein D9615_004795 [Tricholomella constricta]|uniref:Uncharacterized protein n=1 Tax=Tricholomella constricta TaxID=117010 RepID=A0A8H5HGU9_9AGAR|nr:hypothetical protein D9615_004795 [Tricholomella constricta]
MGEPSTTSRPYSSPTRASVTLASDRTPYGNADASLPPAAAAAQQQHADVDLGDIILTQDDFLDIRLGKNEDVPRFFNIGELDGYEEPEYKLRQNLAAEIKELRNLLGRILPAPSCITRGNSFVAPHDFKIRAIVFNAVSRCSQVYID